MTTFAERLNRLFDTVYPPLREPYRGIEVVGALKAAGIKMSGPYLSQLRAGARTNPSMSTMAALASFFGVEAAYFTDDEYYAAMNTELDWLVIARDEGVRRIAARTIGMSPGALREVEYTADSLRREA
jgi:ESX-1-secreted protein regulator